MEIRSFLKNLLYPLPNIARDVRKALSRLQPQNITEVETRVLITLITEELERSRGFGLYVKRRHVIKEEGYFVIILDAFGGMEHMRATLPFEASHRIISDLLWKYFEEENRYYFERAVEHNESVRNKYSCHLESVVFRFLHEVYNPGAWQSSTVH